jgi:hypothetical protein
VVPSAPEGDVPSARLTLGLPNKGWKQTSVEHVGRSQLIASVRRTIPSPALIHRRPKQTEPDSLLEQFPSHAARAAAWLLGLGLVSEIRVFHDVTDKEVQVLAIVSKAEAQAWLDKQGTPTPPGSPSQGEG